MGWTLEQTAHEVLGNQERKSYVSAVEKGRKNLSALTIQKFARCLDLPDAVMDPLLGGAPAADDPATQVEANADRLGAEVEDLRAQLKLSEALAVALAYEFAEGNPTDLESALRELRRAFEVAAEQKARGALPSNTDAAVDEIIAEVDRLNEAGAVEEAGAVLARALEAARDEAERADAKRRRLIEAGISQAVLERSVDSAVALEMERWRLDGGGFEALRNVQDVWYERGRDKGLRFDLEVAIALAPATEDYAANSDQRGTVRNDRGNALQTLGERETGTARLEEALAAYRGALEERTRDRVPLDWAATQNNLGSALQTLGKRESGTARLEEAVAAFRAALEEWTRELVPLDWAMTKNNLGNALATLGQRETSTARLEEAVQA
ncbi:MAG: helix-turn-helix transcriptional regulator, partial [Paracoccaceae bacterium]|nr:helix-turn-helix transcriptional regulator [Paracoccaceae bacterium]